MKADAPPGSDRSSDSDKPPSILIHDILAPSSKFRAFRRFFTKPPTHVKLGNLTAALRRFLANGNNAANFDPNFIDSNSADPYVARLGTIGTDAAPLMLHPLAICGYFWLAWMLYWFVAARSASRRKFTESGLSQLVHSLPLGLGMWLIFRGAGVPQLRYHLFAVKELRWVGVALTALGLLFSVWARVHLGRNWSGIVTLKADHTLIRTGPYRYVRHPIYAGLLVAAIGSALVANTLEAVIGVGLVLVAFLIKMRHEERLLTQEFGDDYRAFKSEVSALVPYIY